VWHFPLTHTAPGWQLSGELSQAWPTFALCRVAQSQTVASVVVTPVKPARKTQLNPALASVQVALPRGLHDSVGGEQKYTPSTRVEPLASVSPVFVQCELNGQSESERQVL
jgi:hypothetical protein